MVTRCPTGKARKYCLFSRRMASNPSSSLTLALVQWTKYGLPNTSTNKCRLMPLVALYQQNPLVSRFAVSVFLAHIESPISKLGNSFFLLLRSLCANSAKTFSHVPSICHAETVNTLFASWEISR